MSSHRTTLTNATLAFLLTTSFLVTLATVPETVSAYTVRDPIYITGDADFTAANGVTGGSGTASDPYIIEGWEIDAPVAHGIQILDTSAHFTIRNCYVHDCGTNWAGISLFGCVNGTVTGNTFSNNDYGMYLDSSSNNTLSNNTCLSNSNYGIVLQSSRYNTLSGNNCSLNRGGINLYSSSNNSLSGNNCSNNDCGMYLESSGNNTLSDNNCSYNYDGIYLYSSSNNALSDNNCSYNYDGIYLDSSSNNTLSGTNCSSNNNYGMYLYSSSNNTLGDNNCSDNYEGIYLDSSSNNTLSNNNCSLNDDYGIRLRGSSNNTLSNNNCSYNNCGMCLSSSSNDNTLSNNNCSYNGSGIRLDSSSNNTLGDNNCSYNYEGIYLGSSSNNTLSDNNCSYNDEGIELYKSSNNALSDNNCSSNNYDGIYLTSSSNNTLSDNNCSYNDYGIELYKSSNNTLSGNNASSNGVYGVYLRDSTGTTVYHNIFFDNTDNHAYDDRGSENFWNSSYPVGGNYWDNYTGVDEFSGPDQDQPGSDGIGDTPYVIDANSTDYYPLMERPNTPPTASFTVSPSTGYVNTVFSVDASSSYDAEDDLSVLEVRWDWESDGGWDTSWSTVKTDTHQYSAEGTHTITLEVKDTKGFTDNTTRQVTVVPDDVLPVAHAGPDQTVDEDTLATFDGGDSSDNIGIVNYTWTFMDGTERTLYGVGPTYTFEDPGEYTITLDVADAADNHATDTVVITVLDVNDPPVADAGTDQTVTVGDTVTFDGSDSSDDVGIENYTWTFTYDDEERERHGVGPTFTFDIAGTYIVTLTVEDAEGETDTDTVTITVEEEEQEEEEEEDEEEEDEEEEDGKGFIESYGLPIGIVVVLAIIALLLFFVLKGRKGGKAPTGTEDAPATEPESND